MNAKQEFIEFCRNKAKVKCAVISKDETGWGEDSDIAVLLKVNYSEDDYNKFLSELDFEYDAGYGGQELFGTIWFKDNSWASRGEYDGSEWWELNKLPDIPEECK